MGPYFATIVDSIREAIASRVLWVVLGLITILLVILAPLGFHEELSSGMHDRDIRDWGAFLYRFREQMKAEDDNPAKHISSLFDEKVRKQLADLKVPGQDEDIGSPFDFPNAIRAVRGAITEAMKKPEFYDEKSWSSFPPLSDEIGELRRIKPEERTEKNIQRLNRLWLESAFPDFVQASLQTSIRFSYAVWDVGPPQPLREEQFIKTVKSLVATVMGWFIGALGVLVAILVTAPIIPQMFDPGSLNLLLSKPVSRGLLFVSKFIGGCGFIGVAATYLIGGLSLILGIRFGVWDWKLLWSIPLYLFLFSIYYSISALAGVIWRNPIISVTVAVLFWLACFLIGTVKSVWESSVVNKQRFASVVQAGDQIIGVNEMGLANVWKPDERKWKQVFVTNEQRQVMPAYYMMPTIPRQLRPVGPIYDAKHEMLVVSMFGIRRARNVFYSAKPDNEWEAKATTASAPIGTFQLLRESSGSVLALSSIGIYRLEGDPTGVAEPVKLFGMKIPLPGGGPFRSVSPENAIVMTQPADGAIDGVTGDLAVYSRGTLYRLKRDETGAFERGVERKFEKEERNAALVAFGGKTVLVARDDGRVLVLNSDTLETVTEFRPEGENQPKSVSASYDGRWFVVLFHTGKLYLIDREAGTIRPASVSGQGTVSCASFHDADKLFVVDHIDQVTKYRVPDWSVEERFSPPLDVWTRVYRYGVVPTYTVFPKPGELDRTFQYVLSGKSTSGSEDAGNDLSAVQLRFDPWAPLWSSAIFTIVMLGIACFYIEAQEF